MPTLTPSRRIPLKWQRLLQLIPGYDSITTAQDAFFVPRIAQDALDFFPECLKHIEGDLYGKPFILEPWQQSVIANIFGWYVIDDKGREVRRYREVLLYVPKKNGKQLALDTMIPTPQGWVSMGDIQPGDTVFDERGAPCSVVAISDIDDTEQAYELSFSNGSTIVAGARHEWLAEAKSQHHRTRIYTTKDMVHVQHQGVEHRANFRIRQAGPLELPECLLDIDPYTLGFWLGNGTSRKPELTVNRGDIANLLKNLPYEVHIHRPQAGYSDTLVLPSLRQKLVAAGIFGDYRVKHIPGVYLRASQAQRWSLLQGLMDSDGSVSSTGQACYCTTVSPLALDVLELLYTLGVKATCNVVQSDRYGVPNQPCYRVLFTAFDDMPVSRLERKLLPRKKRIGITRSDYIYVSEIRHVPSVPMRCIQVDSPSHLYLAGRSMIATHNSPLCSGIALLVLFCRQVDGEMGQQNYMAAADKLQAGKMFRYAQAMVKAEPELLKRCRIYGGNASAGQTKSIVIEEENSFLQILSADADTKEGNTSHLILIDELHVQPNRKLVDSLTTSLASENRKQPLVAYLTTADYDRLSICNEVYDRGVRVRDGLTINPRFLPVIFEAPKTRNGVDLDYTDPAVYRDPKIWAIANPNLGVSVSRAYLETDSQKAYETPGYLPTFLRLHLNVRTQTSSAWLDMQRWDASAGESVPAIRMERDADAPPDRPYRLVYPAGSVPERLRKRQCWAGLDLGATSDLTSLCLLFPEEDGSYQVLWWNWVPEETARKRANKGDVAYLDFIQRGYLLTTPGDETDYETILYQINAIGQEYGIVDIAADRNFQGAQLCQDLVKAGFDVVPWNFSTWAMAAPTQELERLINRGEFHHGGNPVARWTAGHVIVTTDSNGNMKPDKAKSADKIDCVIASIISLGRAMLREKPEESVYNTRGLITL